MFLVAGEWCRSGLCRVAARHGGGANAGEDRCRRLCHPGLQAIQRPFSRGDKNVKREAGNGEGTAKHAKYTKAGRESEKVYWEMLKRET
jgi:hypothetical protein